MPGPFPGMDPWLESHWGDVHHSLVQYARDELQPLLPEDLRARVVLLDPVQTPFANEPVVEGYVEIRESQSNERVAAIEFFSHNYKRPGPQHEAYVERRREHLERNVHVVEIDLLRDGEDVLILPFFLIPPQLLTPYYACVHHAGNRKPIGVYSLGFRKPLASIDVPLRLHDPDVPLQLQALINQCWDAGGFDDVDYTQPADPPLMYDDDDWADELLKEKGLR